MTMWKGRLHSVEEGQITHDTVQKGRDLIWTKLIMFIVLIIKYRFWNCLIDLV